MLAFTARRVKFAQHGSTSGTKELLILEDASCRWFTCENFPELIVKVHAVWMREALAVAGIACLRSGGKDTAGREVPQDKLVFRSQILAACIHYLTIIPGRSLKKAA